MAGNNDWAKNFKARCEDVGWRVKMSGTSHHKVFDSEGKLLLTFSGTPGDKRGMMNALAQAKRCGLETLEAQVKLARERDRLQKIEDDRVANELKLAGIKEQFEAQSDDSPVNPGLGEVNGIFIVAVAPAMMKTPIMKEPRPLSFASELMLSNHDVVYRCERPAATGTKPDLEGICHRTFESVHSLRVHMSAHKQNPNKHLARSLEDTKPMATTEPNVSPNGVSPASKLAARLSAALDTVGLLAQGLDSVKAELTEIQSDLGRIEIADPEVLKKAAQFDNLKAMLS